MKNRHYIAVILFSVFMLLNACGSSSSSTTDSVSKRGDLVSSVLVASNQSLLLPYRVNAYKIIYNTVGTNNAFIKASGLLSVPVKSTSGKSPILSYQHGTIFLDSQAPSRNGSTIQAITTLSGTGFIVSAPDYLGYGESSSTIHPYLHADSLANAAIDMLRASKTFLASNDIKINKQLFLAGYSEGGYATLALQKVIKEQFASEFVVTASAAGAGPFDLSTTAQTLANQTTNDDPSYMSFVLKAYDSVYALEKVSEMYQAPYRDIINSHFDGQHSGSEIDVKLSHTTVELFEAPFLNALQGTGNHVIKDKLSLNNIYDWKPNAPTRFYHSPNDEIVPYSNSGKALQIMQSKGASSVSLVDCPFNTHVDCAFPYVLDALNFFSTYVEDL